MPELAGPAVRRGKLRDLEQPTLAVDELVLRPWHLADAAAVVEAYQDPEIQRWHVRTMTTDEAIDWVSSWAARWLAETGASWAVQDAAGLVGRVGFNAIELVGGQGSAAYWVVPGARGRHVAARALDTVSAWMFAEVGLHRLQLLHSTVNEASCRVGIRAGYAVEGTARQQGLHADGWHDMHLHARIHGDPGPARPTPWRLTPAHRAEDLGATRSRA